MALFNMDMGAPTRQAPPSAQRFARRWQLPLHLRRPWALHLQMLTRKVGQAPYVLGETLESLIWMDDDGWFFHIFPWLGESPAV